MTTKTVGPTPPAPVPSSPRQPERLSRRDMLLRTAMALPFSALAAAELSAQQQPPPPPPGSFGLGTATRPGSAPPPPSPDPVRRVEEPRPVRPGDTLNLPAEFSVFPRDGQGPGDLPSFAVHARTELKAEFIVDPTSIDQGSYRAAGLLNEDGIGVGRVEETVNKPDLLAGKKKSGRSLKLYEEQPGARDPREVAELWRRPDGKWDIREPGGRVVATSKRVTINERNPTLLFETDLGERLGAVGLAGRNNSAQISVQTRGGETDRELDAPVTEGSSISLRQFRWLMAAAGPTAVEAELDAAVQDSQRGPSWRDILPGGRGGWGWLSVWVNVFTRWGSFGVGGGSYGLGGYGGGLWGIR